MLIKPSLQILTCTSHRKKNIYHTACLNVYTKKIGININMLLGSLGCNSMLLTKNEEQKTVCKIDEDTIFLCSLRMFVKLLQMYGNLENIEAGMSVHVYICRNGLLESNTEVASALIQMYVNCNALAKAHAVLHELHVLCVVSWTVVIAAYVDQMSNHEALLCFHQMQNEGISPDYVTFLVILKACGNIVASEKGQEMHISIAKRGLENNIKIGSRLVDMYSKVGEMVTAQQIFSKLPTHDEVSWTALVAGYAEHGHANKSLDILEKMRHEGFAPDLITLVCSLKACINNRDITSGLSIHAEIVQKGKEIHNLSGNALVSMYVKFGLFDEAENVFYKIPDLTLTSWNGLITGYMEYGLAEEALVHFNEMQYRGFSPDVITFIIILKACCLTSSLGDLYNIHSMVLLKGMDEDTLVGNTLVHVYTSFGPITEAVYIFNRLQEPDLLSYTALISGYLERGLSQDAINYFNQMQWNGISPDVIAFSCTLKACINLGSVLTGNQLYANIMKIGFERDPLVRNTVIYFYCRHDYHVEAWEMLNISPLEDVFSWNSLLSIYVEQGYNEQVLHCMEHMDHHGICLDSVSLLSGLKACVSDGFLGKGLELHANIVKKGLETHPSIGNMLADLYAKHGLLIDAKDVFNKLLFQDDISRNVIIAGYAQSGKTDEVFEDLNKMVESGFMPDNVTFLSVLTACSHAGLSEESVAVYWYAIQGQHGFIPTLGHCTSIIDVLGRTGNLFAVVLVIEHMPFHPSSVICHVLLRSCWKAGNLEFGRKAFQHATELDKNDTEAYVCLLNMYVEKHTGIIDIVN